MYRVLIERGINKNVLEFLHSSGQLQSPRLCQCPRSFAPRGRHYETVLYQTPEGMTACPFFTGWFLQAFNQATQSCHICQKTLSSFSSWYCRWNPDFKHARCSTTELRLWLKSHSKLQAKNYISNKWSPQGQSGKDWSGYSANDAVGNRW